MPEKYETVDILVGSYIIPPKVVEDLNSSWDFVVQYYPNYHSSDYIAYADDLEKLVCNEINGNAARILREDYKNDLKNPQIEQDYIRVHKDIYQKAIEGFLNTLKD